MPDHLVKRRGVRALSNASDPRTAIAASDDGLITFQLSPCDGGILVTRTQLRTRGGRLVQSIRFADDATFIRWCDADRLKFSYPLVYANLRRSGCALFSG